MLRSIWQNWLEIGQAIPQHVPLPSDELILGIWPNFISIRQPAITLNIDVALDTYGLKVSFEAFSDENYRGFRQRVLATIVPKLRETDKHFPFYIHQKNGKYDWDSFYVSSDPMVIPTTAWSCFSVAHVFNEKPTPIRIQIHALFVLRTAYDPPKPEVI